MSGLPAGNTGLGFFQRSESWIILDHVKGSQAAPKPLKACMLRPVL